jgi:hypothetical protein
MRWLAGHGERGAAATIVAVLLGGGVVMGFAAISIDVGSLMWERRQVQNGADAAAFALAKTCAETPSECDPSSSATTRTMLSTLNNSNAADGADGFDVYSYGACGRGTTLPACGTGNTSDLGQCPELPASVAANPNIPYVEVHTQTQTSGGSSILPTWLMRTLNGGSTGNTVRACARAAFGSPGATSASAPITFSVCEWEANTNNGSSYYPYSPSGTPGYGASPLPPWPAGATTPPTPGNEIIISLQGTQTTTCPNWNGHDVPGGFGYLANNNCNTIVSQDSWVQIDTGNSLPSGCNLAQYVGKVIYLPVFDCVMRAGSQPSGPPPSSPSNVCDYGTGNNTWYHLSGWAKFYLSGYKVGGSDQVASLVTGNLPCTGNDRCISGWFLEGVLQDAPVAGPPAPGNNNLGTYAVQAAG